MLRRILVPALFVILLFRAGSGIEAHPLGNFSISQYSALRIEKKAVELRYIIDLAEIPTFQEIQESGILAQDKDPNLPAYLTRKAEALSKALWLEINGKRIKLKPASEEIIFPPGAGGLPTMKIGILYRAQLVEVSGGRFVLNYRDVNFPGRAGWKEIIAIAEPPIQMVDSSVSETDRSSQLNNYPTDLLNSPPQVLEARLSFNLPVLTAPLAALRPVDPPTRAPNTKIARLPNDAGDFNAPIKKPVRTEHTKNGLDGSPVEPRVGAPLAVNEDQPHAANNSPLQANKQLTPRNAFTELIAAKQWGWGIFMTALLVAVGLGGFHALEPGHGKTLVAAYLVGAQGTMKDAVWLGLIVTAAHTAGVYLLGAVTLYASRYVMPEQLYPWLGVISGVMITGLGLVLFARRYLGKENPISHHHEEHAHGSSQHHHEHALHRHGHSHHHHGKGAVSLRELTALGVSGGIVPCPAALVVLLSAVSMQRIGFGLVLIVAFSIGLAAVLIVIGLLMVYARRFMARVHGTGQLATRWLPLASSAVIVVFGLALTWQALRSVGVLQFGV